MCASPVLQSGVNAEEAVLPGITSHVFLFGGHFQGHRFVCNMYCAVLTVFSAYWNVASQRHQEEERCFERSEGKEAKRIKEGS